MPIEFPATAFDPELRKAVAEILDILRRYDVAGHVVLASRQHVETRFRFPTWSVAQMEEKNGQPYLRFRAKTGVQDPKDVAHTCNALDALARETGKMCMSLAPLIDRLHAEGFDTDTREGPRAPPWDYR